MYKEANSRLGILCKIKRYITEDTAARIYKTMITLFLEYINFLGNICSKDRNGKLDKLENKALHTILGRIKKVKP